MTPQEKVQLEVSDMVDIAKIEIGLAQIRQGVEDLAAHHTIETSAHVLMMLTSIKQTATQIQRHLGLS